MVHVEKVLEAFAIKKKREHDEWGKGGVKQEEKASFLFSYGQVVYPKRMSDDWIPPVYYCDEIISCVGCVGLQNFAPCWRRWHTGILLTLYYFWHDFTFTFTSEKNEVFTHNH